MEKWKQNRVVPKSKMADDFAELFNEAMPFFESSTELDEVLVEMSKESVDITESIDSKKDEGKKKRPRNTPCKSQKKSMVAKNRERENGLFKTSEGKKKRRPRNVPPINLKKSMVANGRDREKGKFKKSEAKIPR